MFSPWDAQLENLRRNLALALATGKPAILHCRSRAGERDAQDALVAELRAAGFDGEAARAAFGDRPAAVVHSFSGPVDYAREMLVDGSRDRASAASSSGAARRRRRRSCRSCRPERLLVETDSPFLSPPGRPAGPQRARVRGHHGALGRRAARGGGGRAGRRPGRRLRRHVPALAAALIAAGPTPPPPAPRPRRRPHAPAAGPTPPPPAPRPRRRPHAPAAGPTPPAAGPTPPANTVQVSRARPMFFPRPRCRRCLPLGVRGCAPRGAQHRERAAEGPRSGARCRRTPSRTPRRGHRPRPPARMHMDRARAPRGPRRRAPALLGVVRRPDTGVSRRAPAVDNRAVTPVRCWHSQRESAKPGETRSRRAARNRTEPRPARHPAPRRDRR